MADTNLTRTLDNLELHRPIREVAALLADDEQEEEEKKEKQRELREVEDQKTAQLEKIRELERQVQANIPAVYNLRIQDLNKEVTSLREQLNAEKYRNIKLANSDDEDLSAKRKELRELERKTEQFHEWEREKETLKRELDAAKTNLSKMEEDAQKLQAEKQESDGWRLRPDNDKIESRLKVFCKSVDNDLKATLCIAIEENDKLFISINGLAIAFYGSRNGVHFYQNDKKMSMSLIYHNIDRDFEWEVVRERNKLKVVWQWARKQKLWRDDLRHLSPSI